MAHELDMTTGQAAFAYTGEEAWHKMGQRLEVGAPMSEWLRASGMEWIVRRVPVTYQDDKGQQRTYDDKHVLYRSDVGSPLSVMSDGYKIVQPLEVMEVFRKLTEDMGMEMHTAGCLKGGAVYWGLARTNESAYIVDGKDKVGQFVLLSTSVDGTQATTARHTSVRVVCNNTLSLATRGKAQYRKKHRSEFSYDDMKCALGLINFKEEWDGFVESMRHLNSVTVSDKQVANVLKEVLSPKITSMDDITWANLEAAHTRASDDKGREVKGLASLYGSYKEGPGAHPGTLYGVLQGVTHYVDHGRNKDNWDARMTSAWFGSGVNTKDKAHEMCRVLAQVS